MNPIPAAETFLQAFLALARILLDLGIAEDSLKDYLTEEGRTRAKAIADAAEREKFGG